MKRIIKAILRGTWRALLPLRRPINRRAHHFLVRAGAEAIAQAHLVSSIRGAVAHAIRADLGEEIRADLGHAIRQETAAAQDRMLPAIHARFDDAIRASQHAARSLSEETELALGGLVREVARLQMQVEVLQESVRGRGAQGNELSLLNEACEALEVAPARIEGRKKVG